MILIWSKFRIQIKQDFMCFRILSQMGCGESFEGVAVGADMYHKKNVKAFIGPYCNAGMLIFKFLSCASPVTHAWFFRT